PAPYPRRIGLASRVRSEDEDRGGENDQSHSPSHRVNSLVQRFRSSRLAQPNMRFNRSTGPADESGDGRSGGDRANRRFVPFSPSPRHPTPGPVRSSREVTMRMPRFRLRTLMVVVAVAGLALGLADRHRRFRRLAAYHDMHMIHKGYKTLVSTKWYD